MKFNEFNLNEDLQRGIDDTGFLECMPVQEQTLTQTLKGKDVFVQSQTGSGKTAAFLISVFQLFLEADSPKEKKVLIIVPTRELAVQIEKEAMLLGRHLDFVIGSFYGGVGYTKQEKLIREGVNLIIGTPGRLLDFNQSGKLKFKDIDILVIDEADRLFDMGFFPDIKRMLREMKPITERRTMLFSATLSFRVRNLAWEYMKEPAEISIEPDQVTVEKIDQRLYHVGQHEKMNLLLGIMKKENPGNVIIFTNTKQSAYEVSMRLERNGYKSQYIIGDLPQTKRLKIIEGVKEGRIPYLVATDVAARGLHVDDLELVINYDIPEDCESYVHRIGRTARVGKSGKAISLSCERYVYGLEGIEAYAKKKIPVDFADESLFVEDQSQGMRFRLDRERDGRIREKGGRDNQRGNKGKNNNHRKKIERKIQPAGISGKPDSRERFNERTSASNDQKRKSQQREGAYVPKQASNTVKKQQAPVKRSKRPNVKPDRNGTLEQRVEYYNKKYGDDFQVTPEMLGSQSEKKQSLFSKMFQRIKGK